MNNNYENPRYQDIDEYEDMLHSWAEGEEYWYHQYQIKKQEEIEFNNYLKQQEND